MYLNVSETCLFFGEVDCDIWMDVIHIYLKNGNSYSTDDNHSSVVMSVAMVPVMIIHVRQ